MAAPATSERCGCGEPLHYHDPTIEAYVRDLIAQLGPTVRVRVLDGSGVVVHVPRHYIALHGLTAEDLPALAARYGWMRSVTSGDHD